MGIFPVEFPSTTADGFESFRLLHYLAFIKGERDASSVLFARSKGCLCYGPDLQGIRISFVLAEIFQLFLQLLAGGEDTAFDCT